ncbi:hypothetical protein [Thalassobius sp. I31.1]|uniref:hypothetical protein n=1 Tax=Thalassobius sp. I31.1 TaxID=2109912 RepID=UPI000D1A1CE2|nr:hypothetical protein [Thalassobius sp. I31.1]
MPHTSSSASPAPTQSDKIAGLETLPDIADEMLAWRRGYYKRMQPWIASCATIFVLSLLRAFSTGGFAAFLCFILGFALCGMLIYPAAKISKDLREQALPVICTAIGFTYKVRSADGYNRIKALVRTGLFPGHDLNCGFGIQKTDKKGDVKWDRFSMSQTYTDDGKTRTKTTFKGSLLQFQAPPDMPDIILRLPRGKARRYMAASLSGAAVKPMKHEADFTVSLKNGSRYEIFCRDLNLMEAKLDQISDLLDATWMEIPTGAGLQGFECNKGQISIVLKHQERLFDVPGLYTNKLKLVKTFSDWLDVAALPLEIFRIWHKEDTVEK